MLSKKESKRQVFSRTMVDYEENTRRVIVALMKGKGYDFKLIT